MRKGKGQYTELMKNSKGKTNNVVRVNEMRANTRVNMDQSVLEAYERYVLAQFKYENEDKIEKERASAIESLIPGTVYYFHLYFLDLVKKKKTIDEFNDEQIKLYNIFEEKHGQSTQFSEIETWVLVTNRIEGLPKVNSETNEQDIEQNIDVIEYLYDTYVSKQEISYRKPAILQEDEIEGSSLVEENKAKSQTLDLEGKFDRALVAKKMEQKYLDEVTRLAKTNKKPEIDNNIIGFENEINWSIFTSEYVYKFLQSALRSRIKYLTNDSFLEKLAEYFDMRIQDHKKDTLKNPKLETSRNQFDNFTIEQLDKFNGFLRSKSGTQIMDEDENFVSAYFSKIFSSELSSESQEFMNDEEKFQNLETLYLYAKNKNLPASLKQMLLYEALLITLKLEDYKFDLFKEYLKLPKEENFNLKKQQAQSSVQNTRKDYEIWEDCLNNVQQNSKLRVNRWQIQAQNAQAQCFETQQEVLRPVTDSDNVIPKYLEEICSRNQNLSLAEFDEDFTRLYLESIEKKVKVYKSTKGLIDIGSDFDPLEFKRIQDEVLIRFKGSNKEKFEVDEPVFLNVSIKNVPELVIKIFEFNTETYYKKNLKPFDTSIVLHGMVPSFQRTEIFKEVPKNQILDKTYTFDELKGKIGLFIIEMQGNGKTSRAVVKKGSLTLIHRSTAAGHAAFIIDSERKICKGENSGLWLKDKFYQCNLEQNGAILIPYAKSQSQSKIIMIHNGFAQLTEFLQKNEQYDFEAQFHMNTEQMLVGQEASIIIRPTLKINGRKTSVELLKNIKVNLECKTATNEGKVSREYVDLKISDDKETIITFQVPVDLTDVEIKIQATIQNVTSKLREVLFGNQTYHLQKSEEVNKISDFFFKKIGKDNFIFVLGRNGEPIKNQEIEIHVKHKDFKDHISQNLTTDLEGKVCLGPLIDIEKISANAVLDGNHKSETWLIMTEQKDKWTQSTDIHILEGEEVEIPVNITNSTLLPHEANLIMTRHGKIIQNCFSRINVEKADCGLYHLLKLAGLENGNYLLELNSCANQKESINITVHRGEYWENNFILKKNEIFLSSAKKDSLRIDEIEIESTEKDKSLLKINLNNYSKDSHIHLYATQFQTNDSTSLFKMFKQTTTDNISITQFPFARWKNMFESNATIGDEIKYVMDRKKHENRMGNNLDRPSLLNKSNFIRNTQVLEEKIKQGTKYSKAEEKVQANRRREGKGRGGGGGESHQSFYLGENKIKDIQNFLSLGPIQIFNLPADDKGVVKVEIQDLKNYSQLQIVGCNNESVVQRSIDIGTLLENAEAKIQTRDLTYAARKENEDSGLQETRESSILEKGGNIHIHDITSSKVVIIDNCTKIFQVLKEMGNYSSTDKETLPLIDEVYFAWSTFDQKTKREKYSKHTCHELNFFLYVRDKTFFNEVVRDFIKNKMEKTFIDWYLLQQDSNQPNEFTSKILSYINDFTFHDDLNAIELCLFIDTCLKKGTAEMKNKAKILAKKIIDNSDREQKKIDPVKRNRIFDIVLTLSGLDKQENLLDMMKDIHAKEQEKQVFSDKDLFMDAVRNEKEMHEEEDEEEEEEDEDDMVDRWDQFKNQSSQFGFGGPPPPSASGPPPAQRRMMMQSVQPRAMMMQSIQPREMMMQNIQPEMMEERKQCKKKKSSMGFGGGKMMAKRAAPSAESLFDNINSNSEFVKHQRNQAMNDVGFQQLEKTSEYTETHYRGQTNLKASATMFSMNRFLVDYLRYLISDKKSSFISSNFTDLTMKYLPFAMSLLNVPLESKSSKDQHQFKSDGKRGINITSGSNIVIFKKEIMSGDCKIKNDFMVTHRYQNYSPNGQSQDDEISEFLINKIYQCQIIMTNISPKNKQITLLYQIPDGSLPMGGIKYVDSQQYTLSPYTSQKTSIMFYFPAAGSFYHQSSNISENLLVIAKSLPKEINVKEKRVITTIETFADLMKTTPGSAQKKALIIDLIKNNQEKVMDSKYGFTNDGVQEYYMAEDPEFFLNVLEIMRNNGQIDQITQCGKIAFKHRKSLMEDQRFKGRREEVMQLIQDLIGQNGKIKDYIYKPIQSQIFSYPKHELFDFENNHLEYFPMVNQRVFSIGLQESDDTNGLKQIQNVEFSSTYTKFIHLALHQETSTNNHLDLQTKQKLQLAYYLQLQDRIQESVQVFKQIDISQIQADGNELSCQIPYDYMAAYFDYITDESKQFKKAREIVKKYENNHNGSYKTKFNKIREQLEEIDEFEKSKLSPFYKNQAQQAKPDDGVIDPEDSEQITPEKKQQAQALKKKSEPIIHNIEIDENSGQLTISSDNIQQFKVKYYLIDAEILFSRSPFVKDQAEQFSYVKPFVTLEIDSNTTGETKVGLPQQVQNKNVVIEINSSDIQKFKTFYSSKLKINMIEEFGEIKVFNKETNKPLPKTYVKVFCKDKTKGELFFRDGFTDLRGKFTYANASGKSFTNVEKFSILISHDVFGQTIKEAGIPKVKQA